MDSPLSLFDSEDGTVTREARQRQVERVNVGPALARTSDPRTSHAAAGRQRGGTEGEILRVFATIEIGGLTDDALCAQMRGWLPATVKTARSRLKNAGLLEDSGVRKASVTGSASIVWRRTKP